ncbi:MAG TPA: PTS sugar transporter subunit IIB [Anaerolineae bacterium]
MIRIDDRLIHGQVMAVWVRTLGVTHILVIDDATAADPFSRQVMQLAMPPTITLTISSIADAAGHLSRVAADTARTLVLLGSVAAASAVYQRYPFKELNVGGVGMSGGRKLIWRSIAASANEMAQLHALRDAGVYVYLQMIPADQRLSITEA